MTYTTAAYRQSSVLTASSPQLIVMLYDGARRFLSQASAAMAAREIPTAHNKLLRAEQILRHLRNTVDLEQGQIAHNLVALYEFHLRQCRSARVNQDASTLDEVNAMLGQLRSAWATVADGAAAPAAIGAVA
jgi:flagellar secretion chaperone FliS